MMVNSEVVAAAVRTFSPPRHAVITPSGQTYTVCNERGDFSGAIYNTSM